MPDDNPLDASQKETPTDASLTLAQGVSLIQEAMAPMADKITELSNNQANVNQQLADFTQNLGAQMIPRDQGGEPTDFLTELTSGNAEAAIGKVIDAKMGVLTPLLANLMKSGSKAFTDIEATQVDQKFGSGAWEKFFRSPMQHIMDSYAKTNPAALSDSAMISREVNGLKGELLDQLVEHRDDSQQASTQQEHSQLSTLTEGLRAEFRTNGTGGIRSITPVGEEVTPELKEYLAERDRNIGTKTDPKEWLEKTDYGNTLEDYQNKQAELSKANGQAGDTQ